MCVYALGLVVGCDLFFFFQAEDGIRDLVRSRGLGDVYKRQGLSRTSSTPLSVHVALAPATVIAFAGYLGTMVWLSLIHI